MFKRLGLIKQDDHRKSWPVIVGVSVIAMLVGGGVVYYRSGIGGIASHQKTDPTEEHLRKYTTTVQLRFESARKSMAVLTLDGEDQNIWSG